MKMILKADVTFDADDLEDAFRQWRDHFANLLLFNLDVEEAVKEFVGEITIDPVVDK